MIFIYIYTYISMDSKNYLLNTKMDNDTRKLSII